MRSAPGRSRSWRRRSARWASWSRCEPCGDRDADGIVEDPGRAAEDLLQPLGSAEPKLVTLFAAHARDQRALDRAVRERLPEGTRLIGASTGGEVDNQGIHQGTVVMSAMTGDFEVGLGLGKGLAADAIAAGAQATASACAELGVRPQDLDPRRHVGLVIDDGFKYKKEELLLGVLDKNPALTLVGGGACVRCRIRRTCA